MEIFQNPGASIEGNKLELNLRKSNKPILTSLEISGIRTTVYKIKSSIFSKVEIAEELNPKQYRVNPSSHLNFGDTLKAFSILIYFSGTSDFEIVANYSSKHSIQNYCTNGFSYAIINTPFNYFLSLGEEGKKEGKRKKIKRKNKKKK